MPIPLRVTPMRAWSRLLPLLILLAVAGSALANPQAQTLWRLLDYIAVDYPGAVRDGAVVNPLEYQEMTEFSATVRTGLGQLPPHASSAALEARAGALQDAIAAKASPAEVERQARALAEALLVAYPVARAPDHVPDLAGAAALYQRDCASCHGPTG